MLDGGKAGSFPTPKIRDLDMCSVKGCGFMSCFGLKVGKDFKDFCVEAVVWCRGTPSDSQNCSLESLPIFRLLDQNF